MEGCCIDHLERGKEQAAREIVKGLRAAIDTARFPTEPKTIGYFDGLQAAVDMIVSRYPEAEK